MDLRRWIADEHGATLTRFEQSVVATGPLERWTDPAGSGGSSIAWLAFHTALHEDLAVNAVLRRDATVLSTHRADLGLAGVPAATGLGEAEQPELTAALHLERLAPYARAVHDRTASWLASLTADDLDGGDADGPAGLARAGIDEADVPWLVRMWTGKPAAWFVQWEAIGHRVNHLGEMVSVRNRLGLSPF
jgi:hypothetical protein